MKFLTLGPLMTSCLIALALPSCATYTPKPLTEDSDLQLSGRALAISANEFPLPERGSHRFDPRRPLDMDDVALLAVAHNPDLRAARAKIGVAEAQAFAAGILPNPQVAFSYGLLTGGPGSANSILASLSQDVFPLLTFSTRKAAADAAKSSVQLDLAWQEWQIVSRARLLFVDAVSLAKQRQLIEESAFIQKEAGTNGPGDADGKRSASNRDGRPGCVQRGRERATCDRGIDA